MSNELIGNTLGDCLIGNFAGAAEKLGN